MSREPIDGFAASQSAERRASVRLFEAHGLGEYDDTPEVITRRARFF